MEQQVFGVGITTLFIYTIAIVAVVAIPLIVATIRRPLFIRIALLNALRRPTQTILIMVGLMVSSMIFAVSFALGDTVSISTTNSVYESLRTTDILVVPGVAVNDDGSPAVISSEHIRRIRDFADQRVDAVLPVVALTVGVVNSDSSLATQGVQHTVFDPAQAGDLGRINAVDGQRLDLDALGADDVVVSKDLATTLNLSGGDQIQIGGLFGLQNLRVVDIADLNGLYTYVARSGLENQQPNQINTVIVSIVGDDVVDGPTATAVADELSILLADRQYAGQLFELMQVAGVVAELKAVEAQIIMDSGGGPGATVPANVIKLGELISELGTGVFSDRFVVLISDPLVLDALDSFNLQDRAGNALDIEAVAPLNVLDIKQSSLRAARTEAQGFTSTFTFFGSFSIITGMLLIILVFFMLASARQSEMGIMRAIGLRRHQLIQLFALEGVFYSLVASLLGVIFGLAITWGLVEFLVSSIGSVDGGTTFSIDFATTPLTVIFAYLAGLALTLIMVSLASLFASRLNIVVAIRGLPPQADTKAWASVGRRLLDGLVWFAGPLLLFVRGVSSRAPLSIVVAVIWLLATGGLVLAAATSTELLVPVFLLWSFMVWWRLLTLIMSSATTVGITLLVVGLGGIFALRPVVDGNNVVFLILALSAFVVGVGLLTTSLNGRRRRPVAHLNQVALTVVGGLLLVIWYFNPDDPILVWIVGRTVEISDPTGSILLGSIIMVGSAVLIVLVNNSLLVTLGNHTFGYLPGMRPPWRLALAYTLVGSRLRTALILSMFAMVIFILTIFSVITNSFSSTFSGSSSGYDLSGGFANPSGSFEEVEGRIYGSQLLDRSDFKRVGLTSEAFANAWKDPNSRDLETASGVILVVSNADYLSNPSRELSHHDPTYGGDPETVRHAVATQTGLALISGNAFTEAADANSQNLKIDPTLLKTDGTFESFEVAVTAQDALNAGEEPTVLRVVGVYKSNFTDVVDFMDFSVTRIEANYASLPFSAELQPQRVGLVLTEGADRQRIESALEADFLQAGLTLVNPIAQAEQIQQVFDSFLRLFQVYMGLGLVTGTVAIGVIAFRSVVERRRAIGVLRAIGFKSEMVRAQFLMESAFVAAFGSLLGIVLGAVISYQIVGDIGSSTSSTVDFSIPWGTTLTLIAAVIIMATLITIGAAAQAARIKPAETLRTE